MNSEDSELIEITQGGRILVVPRLLAQLELLGDGLVAVDVGGVQVVQQASPLAYHDQQTAA